MYFPYLRGRQSELLALRELASKKLLSEAVVPVLEPTKLSATLNKTIAEFVKIKHNISIIRNPIVGTFLKDNKNDTDKAMLNYKSQFITLYNQNFIIKSLIMQRNVPALLNHLEKIGVNKRDLLIINNNKNYFDLYQREFENDKPSYVIVPDIMKLRQTIQNGIILDDKFVKQKRNSDYLGIPDEFFSDDHLYYKSNGFKGFSDYSIIGNDFRSGFTPFAVAIHIVYFAKDMSLHIKHFVSDSNNDRKNPAKKFYEAVSKLADWYEREPTQLTYGLNLFLEHYQNKTYPGLGTIKKLSIMHHIELMGMFLDGKMS